MTRKDARYLLTMLAVYSIVAFLVSCGANNHFTEQVPGPAGSPGLSASPCKVKEAPGGVLIQCPDGSEAYLADGPMGAQGLPGKDGEDGENGQDGPQGPQGEPGEDAILLVIDPCGDDENEIDEILLMLSDGLIVAWYKNIGLTVLECGRSYVTTDHQGAVFRLTETCQYEEVRC